MTKKDEDDRDYLTVSVHESVPSTQLSIELSSSSTITTCTSNSKLPEIEEQANNITSSSTSATSPINLNVISGSTLAASGESASHKVRYTCFTAGQQLLHGLTWILFWCCRLIGYLLWSICYVYFGIVGVGAGICIVLGVWFYQLISSTITLVPTFPFLVLTYLITDLVGFFTFKDQVARFNNDLVVSVGWSAGILLIDSLVYLGFFGCIPGFRELGIGDVRMWKWILICVITFGFFVGTMIARYALHQYQVAKSIPQDDMAFFEGLVGMINGLLFLALQVLMIKMFPNFKGLVVFGLEFWKWARVATFLILGRYAITMGTQLLVYFLQKRYRKRSTSSKDSRVRQQRPGRSTARTNSYLRRTTRRNEARSRLYKELECACGVMPWLCHRTGGSFQRLEKRLKFQKYAVYYGKGLRKTMSFILNSLSLLLTWILYFKPHLLKSSTQAEDLFRYGTWTCTCLLICAILWFVKACVVLVWEDNVVYDRYGDRVLKAKTQLYLLGIVFASKIDILNILEDGERSSRKMIRTRRILVEEATGLHGDDDQEEDEGEEMDVPTDNVVLMVNYLLAAEPLFPKLDISLFCEEWHRANPNRNQIMSKEDLMASIKDLYETQLDQDDQKLLYETLQQASGADMHSGDLETWMVRSQQSCLALSRTLASATEVVNVLNKLMTGLIIVVVIIIWILLTRITTTKLLVIIASPLVAASFIFGDTCKAMFQGIMFAYIMHPFDVGDICDIVDSQMEVKRIGIWRTTFSKMGSKHEIVYPNSVLANLPIVNYKGNFDADDYVELSVAGVWLDSSIEELRARTERYLNSNDQGLKSHSRGMVVKEMTESYIKIIVYFRHDINFQDMMHFECLEIKEKNKHKLLLEINKFLHGI